MTRKEYFKNMNESTYGSVDPIQVAIKALEQKPCEDSISREALLDKKWDVPYDGKYIQVVDVGDIEELPSVQLKRPKGHWINIDATHSECDQCGSVFEIVSANYCPHCGCKMESKEMN